MTRRTLESKKTRTRSFLVTAIIGIISFLIARAIFTDWDHFKEGLFGY